MAKKPPRLGGELPAYHTMGATKPKKRSMMTLSAPMTSKTVQRSPRENLGTPGTSKFVQRSPRENLGTPGTKNFVQRTPANSSQRMPSVMPGNSSQRMPATFRAPRKPTK
jgi:hypothetical protein